AADARAGAGSAARRLDLASALVKVARLAPPAGLRRPIPCSTLHDGGDIALRVRHLTADRPLEARHGVRLPSVLTGALVLGASLAIALVASSVLPGLVQATTETLVRLIG
ncbi:MAG: hypothetical protein KGN76_14950, partial [Acidobacteriota bacterium]|nr:hypothetical protein [Acidobacteriota bacterium]